MKRKAIFLDRDGVVNEKPPEDHYVSRIEEFRFQAGAAKAIAMLKRLDYAIILVTNQRGIARGFMTESDLRAVHDYMQLELAGENASLDAIYHCPHEKFEECSCRKPAAGMILRAAEEWDVELAQSYMVGDSPSDIAAGKCAGVITVKIGSDGTHADLCFPTLLDFANFQTSHKE